MCLSRPHLGIHRFGDVKIGCGVQRHVWETKTTLGWRGSKPSTGSEGYANVGPKTRVASQSLFVSCPISPKIPAAWAFPWPPTIENVPPVKSTFCPVICIKPPTAVTPVPALTTTPNARHVHRAGIHDVGRPSDESVGTMHLARIIETACHLTRNPLSVRVSNTKPMSLLINLLLV